MKSFLVLLCIFKIFLLKETHSSHSSPSLSSSRGINNYKVLREPQRLKEDHTSDMANFTSTLRGQCHQSYLLPAGVRLTTGSWRGLCSMKNWEMNQERLEESGRGPQGQGGEDAGIATQGPLTPSEERGLFWLLKKQRGSSLNLKRERSSLEATQEFHGKNENK